MSERSKRASSTATWYGRARGSVGAIATIMMMTSLMPGVPAHPQGPEAGEMDLDMGHLQSGKGNTTTTSARSRRLYHVDVTETGEPCVRNELLDRIVDPATYEFGCRDIEVRKFVRAVAGHQQEEYPKYRHEAGRDHTHTSFNRLCDLFDVIHSTC